MTISHSILLYGRNLPLLEIRQMVLSKAGFQVQTATDLAGFEQALCAQRTDLAVLCHTLSLEERGRAAAMAALRHVEILVLTKDLAMLPVQMIRQVRETLEPSAGVNPFRQTALLFAKKRSGTVAISCA